MSRTICSFAQRFFLIPFVAFFLASSARALTFNITYDASVTNLANAAQVEGAVSVATQTLENLYTNSITVNITIYWGATGPFTNGVSLGASQAELVGNSDFEYPQLVTALSNARTTEADSNSVASLPASDPTGGPWYVARSEAKALGVLGISKNDSENDGSVAFASNVSYTFDPTNRAVSGKYDLIGVAEHEITEVMGRTTYNLNGAYLPYDLFRFTSSDTRSFDPNATGVYFSIDDGVTVLKYYNSNRMGDIQDWATSTPPDSFDAFISSGEAGKLSSADLTAVDIIGYKLNFKPPTLTGAALANGNFQINFTNVTGLSFVVLASTNISMPIGNWTNLGAPTESPAGQYHFTDTQASEARFYRVSLP
jgi:hypothetical protein